MQQGLQECSRLELHVVFVFGVPPTVVVRVDGDLLQFGESGPAGGEVGDEAIGSRVRQHALYFGAQFGVRNRAVPGGKVEQLLIGDTAPQECSQATNEFVVLHGLLLLDVRVKQEPGIGEHRHEQVPKSIAFGFGAFQGIVDQGIQFLGFAFGQRPPPRLLGEGFQSGGNRIVIQFAIFQERLDAGRWPLPRQVELDALDHGVACVLHHLLVDGRLASRGVVAAGMGWLQPVRLGKILSPCVGPAIVGPNEVGIPFGHPVLVGHRLVRGRGQGRGILDSKEAVVKMGRDAIGVFLGHGGRIHPGEVEDVAEHLELLRPLLCFHLETVDRVLG